MAISGMKNKRIVWIFWYAIKNQASWNERSKITVTAQKSLSYHVVSIPHIPALLLFIFTYMQTNILQHSKCQSEKKETEKHKCHIKNIMYINTFIRSFSLSLALFASKKIFIWAFSLWVELLYCWMNKYTCYVH